MLRVAREYLDGVTGQRLADREEFVEALSHDWPGSTQVDSGAARFDNEREG